jgi:hypothetical protein
MPRERMPEQRGCGVIFGLKHFLRIPLKIQSVQRNWRHTIATVRLSMRIRQSFSFQGEGITLDYYHMRMIIILLHYGQFCPSVPSQPNQR